jgi:hypothetical protein
MYFALKIINSLNSKIWIKYIIDNIIAMIIFYSFSVFLNVNY